MKKQHKKGKSSGPSFVDLAKQFQGIDFPVNKQDLIEHAKKNNAQESVMNMLDEMEDREYDSMKDVIQEYGKHYQKAA
jgi:hypothetical protein